MKKYSYFENVFHTLCMLFEIHGAIMSDKCPYHAASTPRFRKYYPKAFWYWLNTCWVEGD